MDKAKAKILILVEGPRTDTRLMEHLFRVYGIDTKYEIVSYNTNIYVLYNEMFYDGKPEDMDVLQVLKEHEPREERKRIFEQEFTDILLIFDLDPQDPLFSEDKISKMTEYFSESTDMGKLYLNYPMVEAFYHMTSIPDPEYNARVATLDELRGHTYKQRVNAENRNHGYSKFAVTHEECNVVIRQNIEKGWHILSENPNDILPNTDLILNKQLVMLRDYEKIYVLCTCVFFIAEYNPKLLK
ncbi:MAG: hypothetical protein BWY15_02048 [Firmicutes bacterium ADurb.Bin193]|nr:MAG: hypothetical protein BWY15_02048 [Firmicutes bacterium ADurb.Bin193]